LYSQRSCKGHASQNSAISLDKSVRPGGLVCGLQTPGWWPDLAVGERELDLRIVELLGVHTLAHFRGNGGSLDDLDTRRAHPMTRSHLIIHLLNCSVECKITVFLVHVVVAGSALVPHPDTVVLDGSGILLENLTQAIIKDSGETENFDLQANI